MACVLSGELAVDLFDQGGPVEPILNNLWIVVQTAKRRKTRP
jgi:hypothetical protein